MSQPTGGPVLPAACPQTPVEKLQFGLDQIQSSLKQAQFLTDQQRQGKLGEAATAAGTAQQLGQMLDLASQLTAMAQPGTEAVRTNLPQVQAVLEQLHVQLGNERSRLELEVSQKLQQAIASMAQAQQAMVSGHEFSRLVELAKQGSTAMQDLKTPGLM